MESIATELLKKLQKSFAANIEGNQRVWSLYDAAQKGTASYEQAEEFAYEIGEALAAAFKENLNAETLPGGRINADLAEEIIRPMLKNSHEIITDVVEQVQTALNRSANIGIKALVAPVNEERIDGIISRLSNAEQFEDIAWILNEPVVLFSQMIVEDALQKNAEFHYNAGLKPRIVRRHEARCCKWCRSLAGEYSYPNVPKDVYRRHERCRCVVEYFPGNGRRQNVHTKQWAQPLENARKQSRQIIGVRVNENTVKSVSSQALEQLSSGNVTIDSVKSALSKPLKVQSIKQDQRGRPVQTIIGQKATVTMNPKTGEILSIYPTHSKTVAQH